MLRAFASKEQLATAERYLVHETEFSTRLVFDSLPRFLAFRRDHASSLAHLERRSIDAPQSKPDPLNATSRRSRRSTRGLGYRVAVYWLGDGPAALWLAHAPHESDLLRCDPSEGSCQRPWIDGLRVGWVPIPVREEAEDSEDRTCLLERCSLDAPVDHSSHSPDHVEQITSLSIRIELTNVWEMFPRRARAVVVDCLVRAADFSLR
jgi:hypothetical protein